MSAGRLVGLVMAAGLLSGCAMGRTRQDMARLQSQVGLLEERITQLERTGMGGSTASLPSDTPAWEGTTVGSGTGSASKRSSGSKASVTTSSVKPSTREIQQALKNAGFYQGAVDGKLGPKTREAIREFQRVNGLKDDGVVGKQTWAKLHAYADLSANSTELSAAEILK